MTLHCTLYTPAGVSECGVVLCGCVSATECEAESLSPFHRVHVSNVCVYPRVDYALLTVCVCVCVRVHESAAALWQSMAIY